MVSVLFIIIVPTVVPRLWLIVLPAVPFPVYGPTTSKNLGALRNVQEARSFVDWFSALAFPKENPFELKEVRPFVLVASAFVLSLFILLVAPLSVSYSRCATIASLRLIQTNPPSPASAASKGPKVEAETVETCVRVCELLELSVNGSLPCKVNKTVPDTAVNSDVGAVKLEVYKAVPLITRTLDKYPLNQNEVLVV